MLDVGCGENLEKRNSIRVDRTFSSNLSACCNATNLSFLAETFNCCTMVASIAYIASSDRKLSITECNRVLKKYGRLIITCTTPLGGFVHCLFRWGQPRGLSVKVIRTLVEENGFRLVYDRPFMLWLNHLYVFGKEVSPTEDLRQIQKVIKEEVHSQ